MKTLIPRMERQSPVALPGETKKIEMWDNWPVVLEYADEGPGPWLIDLSHCPRWDVQSPQLNHQPLTTFFIPSTHGDIVFKDGVVIGRIGPNQGLIWFLNTDLSQHLCPGCTETTEGTICLALLGKDALHITEKLTELDLAEPERRAPFILLGQFSHITSQIVVLSNDPQQVAILVSCQRGFAHDMTHAVLSAGKEFMIRSAGQSRFRKAFSELIRLGYPRA